MTADFDVLQSRHFEMLDHSVSVAETLSGEEAAALSPGGLCPVPGNCMLLCSLREAVFLGYFPSMKVEALSVTASEGEKFSFYEQLIPC